MFQQFNTDTLVSRFIKNLIYNTPIPLYKTVRDGDWVTKDCFYIYKHSVIKCTRSGFVYKGNSDKENKASYITVKSFMFGEKYPQITENFMSKNAYYDYETHEKLGNYLRCMRDLRGVDLMPFYNCFSSDYTSTFYIRNGAYYDGVNSEVQVTLIPIKFNKTYTIAVDCSSTVELLPVILCDRVPLRSTYSGSYVDLNEALVSNYQSVFNASFKKPFTYSVSTYNMVGGTPQEVQYAKFLEQNERSLYLVIQLPKDNESSLVVLEGDYTDLTNKQIDIAYLEYITDEELNKVLLSELSLLRLNDSNEYAFSDRLVEYLFRNAIDVDETIDDNISFVQYYLGISDYDNIYSGVWDTMIRLNAYNYYKQNYQSDSRLEFIDINGFIDKDVERLMMREN